MNVGVPPQKDLKTQLQLAGQLFETTKREAKRIAGLKLNLSKSGLLLPLQPDGSPYDVGALELPDDFPDDLRIVTTGLKIGGAPVGTDAFIRDFTEEVLDHFEERATALPGINPQVGFGLLRLCVASAPVYLAQVTPPQLTHDLFERFNTRMVDCGLEMLTQPGQPEPSYSAMRRARARQRMQLPLRHKGMGVLSITLRHPIAYFASVASCLVEDKTLARHVNGLRDFAADTHERVLAAVGPAGRHTETIEDLIGRDDPLVLLKPHYFVNALLVRDDKRIQRALTYVAHKVQAEALDQELARGVGPGATQDLVAACSKDIGHVVFTARLSDKYNRLSPDEFICWTRRYLQLPPLTRLGNAAPREGFDYDMEECMGDHNEGEDAWLDIYGNHGNGSCAPTMHGKHKGHTLLKWAINRFASKVPGVQ